MNTSPREDFSGRKAVRTERGLSAYRRGKFVIKGPAILRGNIQLSGSKNAALPILAATLLTVRPCTVRNIPRIEDVYRMVEILRSLGAKVFWINKKEIRVEARHVRYRELKRDLVSSLRASILLLGPLAVRLGKFSLPFPGGDNIGARPIHVHLNALKAIGISAAIRGNRVWIEVSRKKVKERTIILDEFSVTATENMLMAGSLMPSRIILKGAAAEPHVQDLGIFLQKLGVPIKGLGTHTIEMRGKKTLGGASHTLITDPIEAGTFLIMGALAEGGIGIQHVNPMHLELFFQKLEEIGVRFNMVKEDRGLYTVHVWHSPRLKAFSVKALPFPGIPTDLQALFGLLATQARGKSLIHDPLYENRFRYSRELKRMGANIKQLDPHRIEVMGPTKLLGVPIRSFDLRAGATLIIAGLIAKGTTVVMDAYQVDRGYEEIEKRLQELGADIKRV